MRVCFLESACRCRFQTALSLRQIRTFIERRTLLEAIPGSLKRIELGIAVAGRVFRNEFPPLPNQSYRFVWDGLDAHGQHFQGAINASFTLTYVYDANYRETARFGSTTGLGAPLPMSGNKARAELNFTSRWAAEMSAWDAREVDGLGGWSVDSHHSYLPSGRRLRRGDGKDVRGLVNSQVFETVTEGPCGPYNTEGTPIGARQAPNGDWYFFGYGRCVILRVPEHAGVNVPHQIVAGTLGACSFAGDGGPATAAEISSEVNDIAFDLEGGFYIADTSNRRVRHVDGRGIITTVAGSGYTSGMPLGDGGPAILAKFTPSSLAVGTDGSLYAADESARRIRRVATDGTITTYADGGASYARVEGSPATQFSIVQPRGLTFGLDGTLYFADTGSTGPDVVADNWTVTRVTPEGTAFTVPGIGAPWLPFEAVRNSWGGIDYTTALTIEDVAVSRAGTLYVLTSNYRYRVAEGQAIRVAGGDATQVGLPSAILGGPALRSVSSGKRLSVAASNGEPRIYTTYLSNQGTWTCPVYALTRPLPGLSGNAEVIVDESGEQAHVFDARGRHVETRSIRTNSVLRAFEYDASGYLVRIRDEAGNDTTVERDASGKATAIIGPYGQRTTLTIDSDGYLRQVRDPSGAHVDIVYDGSGLMTRFTDSRSNASQMVYDTYGRIVTDTTATAATISATAGGDPFNWSVALTTPEGRTKVMSQTSTDDGVTTSTVLQLDGSRATSVVDGTAVRVTTMRDGTRIKVTPAPDPMWRMAKPLNTVETRTPSGLARVESTTRTVTTDPNSPLLIVAETLSNVTNGRTTKRTFGSDRTYVTSSPVGRLKSRLIDTMGRTVRTTSGGVFPINYDYDANGRLFQVTQGTRSISHTYSTSGDTNGYVSQVTDAANQTTVYTPDILGRILFETLGASTTNYGWDAKGNLATVTPPGKPTHQQEYTASDLLGRYTPAAAGIADPSTIYTYNLERQPLTTTQAGGVVVRRQHDNEGRLSLITTPTGSRNYSYYLPNCTTPGCATGHLASIIGPGTALTYTWDGQLMKGVAWSGAVTGQVGFGYDTDFRVASDNVVAPTGASSMQYKYDPDSLLTCASPTSCSPAASDALTLTYQSNAPRLSGTTLGTITDALTYNSYGELASATTRFGSTLVYSEVLDTTATPRDALGRIVTKSETRATASQSLTYAYDIQGRLTDVRQGAALVEHFEYDLNGNRLRGTVGGTTRIGTFDDQDRLLTYGPYTYGYTPNGELFTKTDSETGDVTTYHYDALGNLLSVELPDSTLIEYVIDGQNRRIGKRVDGILTKAWLYKDQLKPIAEMDGSGNLTARFVYGSKSNVPDVLMKYNAGLVTTYRVISDHLGSPITAVNVNISADVPFKAEYSAFGERTVTTGAASEDWMPFGFAGGLYDADTGLTRFGARDYDPEIGRWTHKDPSLFNGGQANLYAYAGNDPVNYVDATGHFAVAAVAIIGAAVGGSIYLDLFELPMIDAEETGLPGPVDGPQDAYRHCLASCVATGQFSEGFAKWLEGRNEAGNDLCEPGTAMDLTNDSIGRGLGNQTSGFGSAVDECRSSCMDAVGNGTLTWLHP